MTPRTVTPARPCMQCTVNHNVISIIQGDLTEVSADAIVNAANERLAHGGGVAGAISRKGGPVIQNESNSWLKKYGRVRTGDVAVTGAGGLKAQYVIHAVGPVMGSGDEDAKLLSATKKSLEKAEELHLQRIAFPAISTGIFGYPMDRCAAIMVRAAMDHLAGESELKEVVFCLWSDSAYAVFCAELAKQCHTQ